MCLLKAFYHLSRDDILNMTDQEIHMHLYHLPSVLMRMSYQQAQFEAVLLNALGGKKSSGRSTPASQLYQAIERLNPFARPAWIDRIGAPGKPKGDFECTPGQAQALLKAVEKRQLPSWCKQTLDQLVTVKELQKMARS